MSDDTPRSPEAQRIAEVWGEPFVRFATNPRVEFGDDAIRVTLWKPIKVNGVDAPAVALGEPTLDQLQQLDRATGGMAKTRRLLMQVGGLSEKEAGTLGLRDITLCGAILEAFTETARETGA